MATEPMLDVEDGANVARFLQSVQPLRGCDFSRNTLFRRGDQLIREYAASLLLGKPKPKLSVRDAAAVLRLMNSIEPLDGETIFDGAKTHCGYMNILAWVEQSLVGKGVARG